MNNDLYKDAGTNENVELDANHMLRVAQMEQEENNEEIEDEVMNHYMPINENSRIMRGKFHQGMPIFGSGYEGRQCCAMAAAAITKAQLLTPREWTTAILDEILWNGDNLYSEVRILTTANCQTQIPDSGYLLVRNFNVIKNDYLMYGDHAFSMNYADYTEIYGTLNDEENRTVGVDLIDGLNWLFLEHSAGILIARQYSYAVMKVADKFYFYDSHATGQKGGRVRNEERDGKTSIIECDTIQDLETIIKRAFGGKKNCMNVQYTLDYVDVHHKVGAIAVSENFQDLGQANEHEIQRIETTPVQVNQIENIRAPSARQYHDEVQTTAMMNCDIPQPDVEDEFTIQGRTIIRKTKDNLVNINVEKKAEEFAWWHLFPYGINGLNQERQVKMTPLQYFQYRILGKDKRFWNVMYLFYALAIYEYLKMQATVNLCGKRIDGSHGPPDDVHTYLKNMRGTGAYWNTACHELCDIIKSIGPPHYFVTFSCNDLNWADMRKALLIADGKPNEDPEGINFNEAQRLIEKYPVVVARHFNHRTGKLFTFILNNGEKIFGGKVIFFWFRVEFQLRGSAHLHPLFWIENHPDFHTAEGITRINQVVSSKMPDEKENPKLYELVDKLQRHRHTHTCYKGEDKSRCRFRFPRPVSTETRLLAQDSNEFIQNGGRICILERNEEERYINNYNPLLLELWSANIDIQPCGSDDSIAYYIAKYVAKAEPTELDKSIRQAINQIRQEESNIQRKMFKICYRIMKERQVSAIEAAYRLCGFKMRESNITTVFLNTRQEKDRYRLIKKGPGNTAAGYCTNIFDRYQMRPRAHPDFDFENMSLTEFAMQFEPYYQNNEDDEVENVDADIEEQEQARERTRLITLADNSKMKIRNKRAVIRVPRLNSDRDPESYYYSLLLQYKPYLLETELLEGFETAKEAFLACEEELKQKNAFMEVYRRRDKELENALAKAHAVVVFEECNPVNVEEIGEEIDLNGQDVMNNEQYQQAMAALNVQQKELLKIITDSILAQLQGSRERFRIFLTGNAGCGKTFTMKAVQNQIIRLCGNDPSTVKLCALTGDAAVLVNGSTIHSLFRLPVQKDGKTTGFMPLSGVVLRMKRLEWRNVNTLIFDEVSMISYEMLTMIESRARQMKNNENELFGGLNILLCGDLMQLPPIRAHQIFDQPKHMEAQIHLWRQFRLCELVENMRQKGDQTFINILNALRVGELKLNQAEDLMKRVGTNDGNMSGEFDIGKALRIYPTNKQVADHNNLVLEKFKKEGQRMFTIKAQDNITNGDYTKEQIKAKISDDINKTAGLPASLTIFVGAKVMLRSNIDVTKKLVNGSIGYITEIIWPLFRRDQMYEDDIPKVKVKFDGGVGEHTIEPIRKEFQAKGNALAERYMLPLVLSWASTGHKMQGSTLDYAVVSLENMFAEGLAYVILSRVRSLEGLRIESIDLAQLVGKKPCNEAAKQELERMRNQEKN